MELDTGTSASVLCEDTYKQIRQQSYVAPLSKTTNTLSREAGLTSWAETGCLNFQLTSARLLQWSPEVLDKYSEVFKDELGCVKDGPVGACLLLLVIVSWIVSTGFSSSVCFA